MFPDGVTYIVIGALCGGFVSGLAGFGTALFALGFFLQVVPLNQAVGMTVILAVTTGLPGLWTVRHSITSNPRRTARFLVPALIGIPFGVSALSLVDPDWLKLVIATFMILYGVFFLLRRQLPKFERPTPIADALIGLLGGFMGGLAGLSGALPAMWCALRPWPRHETRAVLQPFNVAILLISAIIFAFRGAYPAQVLPYLATAIITANLSALIGLTVFKRLEDSTFRWLIIALMLASGSVLLLRTLA